MEYPILVSLLNVIQYFCSIHCFFCLIDLPVVSPPVSLSPQVVVPEENPLGDDEVDGVLASMDMDFNTPPSSPPVSFLYSWTISERQRIEDRRRSNLLRGMQLKTRYNKFKKNRQK